MYAVEYLPHYSCGGTDLMKIENKKELDAALKRIEKAPKHPTMEFKPIVYKIKVMEYKN